MKKLIISLILPFSASILAHFSMLGDNLTWYNSLTQPWFTPPSWLFGPVWFLLYVLMGISFYLVWSSENKNKGKALTYYLIQLLLNALWTPLFFGLQNPEIGLIEIILLTVILVMTIIEFHKIDKRAAYLLYPYLAWTIFATILNAGFWWLN